MKHLHLPPIVLIYLAILLLIIFSPPLLAQSKLEREFKIKETAVPQSAREFISSCGFTDKIKWYREENGTIVSFEAKTRKKKNNYSIEFSETGVLEDAEVLSRLKWLNKDIILAIESALSAEFRRYRIEKMQIQYSGADGAILNAILSGISGDCLVRYELIVAGTSAAEHGHFEMLFSEKGVLLERTKLAKRGTENIEY
jgi:hypothetical protein